MTRPCLPPRAFSDGIDAVVLRRCLEGLSEVVDAPASMEDRDVVVSFSASGNKIPEKRLPANFRRVLR